MKFKRNLAKATAVAALSFAGMAAVNTVKPELHPQVQAAVKKVKIHYVPGYGINIWTNYEHKKFTGVRAAHGATYAVWATAYDKKGRKWYQIGTNQWIMAKYTRKVTKKKKAKRTTTAQATSKAAAVVSLAKAQLGKRYVWGATGPSSFDCSGLTQYVYSHAAGINITRTTYTQVNQGRTVSMNSLKPGDLLFWGSASAPYHVGIYVGNGKYVHAATPSQGVIEQTLSVYFYPSVAKRILN